MAQGGKGGGFGPLWLRAREAAVEATLRAADRVRDYDVPARLGVAKDHIRAMELDRKAAAVARVAARKAQAGGKAALREGLSGARAASIYAGRKAAIAAREAGPLSRKAWNRAARGVVAARTRHAERAERAAHRRLAEAGARAAAAESALLETPADAPLPPPVAGKALPLFPAEPARWARPPEVAVDPASAAGSPAATRLATPAADKRNLWMAGFGGLLIGASAVAVAAVPASAPGGVVAAPGTPERAALERVIRDYILEHPEILPEAMQRLQNRESARLIDANRQAIEAPFAGAWAGAADGDVTLVEFFDYACGFCRQSVPDIDRLLREDSKLKVVFRELPILSQESEDAAKVSLAAAKQGNFMAFHRAMYAAGRPGAASIAEAQRQARLDSSKVTADRNASDVRGEIDSNLALARTLQMTGTPTWIVGDRILSGAVGYDQLKRAIADSRARAN